MITLATGTVFAQFEIYLYFTLNSVIMALPFFVAGMWMKKRLLPKPWLWGGISLGILLLANHYNGRVDMATFRYGRSILLYYAGGFAGTFLVFVIAQLLNRYSNRLIRGISEGTVLIIGFNLLAIEVITKCGEIFGLSPEQNLFVGVVMSMVILLLFYPGILLSKKYFPCLIGKQNKLRL